MKADPMARQAEIAPATASVVERELPRLGRRRVDGAARVDATRTTAR